MTISTCGRKSEYEDPESPDHLRCVSLPRRGIVLGTETNQNPGFNDKVNKDNTSLDWQR